MIVNVVGRTLVTRIEDIVVEHMPAENAGLDNILMACYDVIKAASVLTLPFENITYSIVMPYLIHTERKDNAGNVIGRDLTLATNTPICPHGGLYSYTASTDIDSLYDTFYEMLSDYLITVETLLTAEYNAYELTLLVNNILRQQGTSYTIAFTCGTGISELTDNTICIGLAQKTLLNLGTILDMKPFVLRQEIVETFDNLPCVVECMRRKTPLARKLGIYSLRSAKTIIRGSYHKQLSRTRNGIAYLDKDGLFGLVDCAVCNDKELAQMRLKYADKLVVVENTDPKTSEYVMVKTQDEVDRLKAKYEKRGALFKCFYDEAKQAFKIITRPYRALAYCFGPLNLQTYETVNNSVVTDLFEY